MIKEVFIITEGILEFYYSPEPTEENIDQAILSSGLLDAIRSFTEHTREERIDSFTMEKERFFFRKCDIPQKNKTLIIVFNTEIPEKYAKSVLDVIHDEVRKTSFIKEDMGMSGLETEEKRELKNRIAELSTQLFSTEYEAEYVNDLLSNRQNIPLAFLLDNSSNQLITSFSRPKALFKPQIISEFNLFHSSLKTTLNRLNLNQDYLLFTISSSEYVVASIQSGNKIAVASGALMINEDTAIDATLNMCHYTELKQFMDLQDLTEENIVTATLTADGELLYDSNSSFPNHLSCQSFH